MRPKPLLKSDIERAMAMTKSNRAASRYLHCSYIHYKRYAKNYTDENGITLFDKHKNQSGKGVDTKKMTEDLQEYIQKIKDHIAS